MKTLRLFQILSILLVATFCSCSKEDAPVQEEDKFYTVSLKFNGDNQPAFCSTTAFKTTPTLKLSDNYQQQEFCGVATGKGKYPELPQNCKN